MSVSALGIDHLVADLAKRWDSYYASGKRSGAWLKYRINRGQEIVIGGYVSGNPIDSIIVGYYQEWHTAVRGQGAKRLCSPHPPCGSSQAQGTRNRHLSICEFARAQAHADLNLSPIFRDDRRPCFVRVLEQTSPKGLRPRRPLGPEMFGGFRTA